MIPSNQWLYTQFVFSQTGYQFSVSKTGYGNTDFLSGSKAYGAATWDGLADAHLFFQFGDNYKAGAYFEVAEASIYQPAAARQRHLSPNPRRCCCSAPDSPASAHGGNGGSKLRPEACGSARATIAVAFVMYA